MLTLVGHDRLHRGRLALVACLLAAGLAMAIEPLPVLVTIPPHASLVERLGGDAVTVDVVLAPGESPASFDPTPRQVERLTAARVWFTTGAPLEVSLVPRLAALAPDLVVVPIDVDLADLPAACDDHGHEHDHGEVDPHVWLSVRNTRAQVAMIAVALGERLPDRAGVIADQQYRLEEELRTLDAELEALLASVAGRTLFVFHPAFGYFARDYDLHQVAVERGGLAPSPRHLAELMTAMADEGATTIFLQPQHSDHLVRNISRDNDLEVVVLDPLARDHVANLRRIGEAIANGLAVRP